MRGMMNVDVELAGTDELVLEASEPRQKKRKKKTELVFITGNMIKCMGGVYEFFTKGTQRPLGCILPRARVFFVNR